jgi:hypothetical protein
MVCNKELSKLQLSIRSPHTNLLRNVTICIGSSYFLCRNVFIYKNKYVIISMHIYIFPLSRILIRTILVKRGRVAEGVAELLRCSSKIPTFYHNDLAMRITADVIIGSQSPSDCSLSHVGMLLIL